MDILENLSLELIFFIVFGAAVFVSGTTKLRRHRQSEKGSAVWDGVTLKSRHIHQKDKEGRLIQNYYELRVEYKEQGHKKQADIKSVREYLEGDQIRIQKRADSPAQVYDGMEEAGFTPWFLIGLGLLTAVFPIVNTESGMTEATAVLAGIFLLLGLYFILSYLSERRRITVPLQAEIAEVLCWKKGKERSKISKQTISYYPILAYECGGEIRHMRSRYNFNSEGSCKVGSKRTLYYDEENKCLIESAAKKSMLIWGSVFLAVAATGLINIIYLRVL